MKKIICMLFAKVFSLSVDETIEGPILGNYDPSSKITTILAEDASCTLNAVGLASSKTNEGIRQIYLRFKNCGSLVIDTPNIYEPKDIQNFFYDFEGEITQIVPYEFRNILIGIDMKTENKGYQLGYGFEVSQEYKKTEGLDLQGVIVGFSYGIGPNGNFSFL